MPIFDAVSRCGPTRRAVLGTAAALSCGLFVAGARGLVAQGANYGVASTGGNADLTTRVWLDRGDDPVLDRGDRARVYYRASFDAFVAVFQIDTNGTMRLLYPRSPEEHHYVRGGRDFRLVFRESSSWVVADDPGVGYFFSVASPEPFDFRELRYSPHAGGWDLSQVGRHVYSDPYVAMDDVVAALIPDWDVVPYALDFTSYHVEQRYEYPRFLCYDCHGFRPYASWNPYMARCTNFRVVVHDDPYYYPVARYRGSRVVYVRPSRPRVPRFEFKERAWGTGPGPARMSPGRRPSEALPGRGRPPPAPIVRRPTLERRPPSGAKPGRRPVIQRGPPPRAKPGRSSSGKVRPPGRRGGGGA